MADVRDSWLESGTEPISSSSAEFARMIADGADRYKEIVKRAGIKQQL
jgi:tripartite-type tricarboxylate transporter receptor subunit TctC